MILVGVGLGIVVALLRGGKFSGLYDLGIKGLPLVYAALFLRLAVTVLASRGLTLPWLQVFAYLLFFGAMVTNLALYGFKLFSVGSLLNFVVIAANGGAMPVSPRAIAFAQLSGIPTGKHTLLTSLTRLPLLADIIPLRPPYFPARQIISIRDLFIVANIFIFIQCKMMEDRQPKVNHEIRP